MANKPITEKSAGELVYGDGITLRYGADNGEGYPKECNLYNSLYFLAGEDVMKQVRQGKMSLSELENQIGLKTVTSFNLGIIPKDYIFGKKFHSKMK